MKAKTELLLLHLLYSADMMMRPTFRNLNQSFEGWAYKSGFLPQIHRLEAEGFLESNKSPLEKNRLLRLTETGRLAALGGRDPVHSWSSPWDGKWRLFLFDIPEKEQALRRHVNRALSRFGCGCLQGSVWISPRIPAGAEKVFEERGADCSHLLMLEANSRGLKVDQQMVKAAWNFSRINDFYRHHLEILGNFTSRAKKEDLLSWSKFENQAWLNAVRSDPLLPERLLPTEYLGVKAWEKRRGILRKAAHLVSMIGKQEDPEIWS